MSSDVVFLIPAYNESASIVNTVNACKTVNKNIVVIDDGSEDDTSDLATRAGASVLRLTQNLGYENALRRGFEYIQVTYGANCKFVVTFDADGEHKIDSVVNMLSIARSSNCELLLIGARSRYNRLSEHVVAAVGNLIWGVTDPLCGLRVYSQQSCSLAKTAFAPGCAGLDVVQEARRQGIHLMSEPIKVGCRADESRFGNSIKGELRILKALLKVLFNRNSVS